MEVPGQIDHYSLDHLIATTTTACIYRGTDLLTSHTVAIKIPHLAIEGDPSSTIVSAANSRSARN